MARTGLLRGFKQTIAGGSITRRSGSGLSFLLTLCLVALSVTARTATVSAGDAGRAIAIPPRTTAPAAVTPSVSRSAVAEVRVPILAYHLVDRSVPRRFRGRRAWALTVSPGAFTRQMGALRDGGYRVVALDKIYRALTGGAPLPPRSVALTFDDGYQDNFANVFPTLKRFGFTASFFVITGKIGRPGYMDWPELRQMRRAGMDIEPHTVSHSALADLPRSAVLRELTGARDALRSHLGVEGQMLAYPYGSYDRAVEVEARQAGYLMALTTRPGLTTNRAPLLALPRVPVWPRETVGTFLATLRTGHAPLFQAGHHEARKREEGWERVRSFLQPTRWG